jgi:hypothetical protein
MPLYIVNNGAQSRIKFLRLIVKIFLRYVQIKVLQPNAETDNCDCIKESYFPVVTTPDPHTTFVTTTLQSVKVVAVSFTICNDTPDAQGQQELFSDTCTSVVNESAVPVLCACGCATPSLYNCRVVDALADASTATIYTPHLLSLIVLAPDNSAVQPFFNDTF